MDGAHVDLEGLLSSKDDLDLNDNFSDESPNNNNGLPGLDAALQPRVEEVHECFVDVEHLAGVGLDNKSVFDVNALGSISIDDVEIVADEPTDINNISAIEKAELCEQQFLSFGKRASPSALQAKRHSSTLLGYSNVRCEELPIISSQLQRNANYKQHGPGLATCLVVSPTFIAVGTTKGLIILFDHEQEIRQVLGSNIPNLGRPIVPVSSMDVTKTFSSGNGKSMEGYLLSGYDSGEVSLWDVAKGVILKVISDLHSSQVVVASILETITDGLPSLAAGTSALVPLPQGWYGHDSSSSSIGRSEFTSNLASAAVASMQGVNVVVITADKEGVMYKSRLSKSMWSATYTSESECLLDSSTGPLTGYAALPPLLRSIQTNNMVYLKNCNEASPHCRVSCRYLAAHKSTRVLAINVGASQTWIVQTHPKIKIVFKWDAPLHGSSEQGKAEADDKEGADCTNGFGKFLDWTWQARSAESEIETRGDERGAGVGAEAGAAESRPVGDAHWDATTSTEGGGAGVYADWVPVLARCWGSRLQLLSVITTAIAGTGAGAGAAEGPVSNLGQTRSTATTNDLAHSLQSNFSFLSGGASKASTVLDKEGAAVVTYKTKFAVAQETSITAGQRVLSIRWVSSCELVVLTTTDVLVLSDALQPVEQLSLQPSASMELSRLFAHNVSVHQEELIPLQHGVSGRLLFVIASDIMLRVQMQSCFDLADRLISKGQWLEALALVLENARRSPAQLLHCGAELDKYIIRYVELAVKQSAHSHGGPASNSNSTSAGVAAQSKNHYHLVSGVCIEYCVASSRMDVLFAQVYSLFKAAQQHYIFLEALEPFVLAGEIRSLPPALIAEFCESALRLHRLPSIERCVAYFEIAHLDMNFITKFLYENRMYSSFLYVYSNGLDDFPGAFQIIFSFLLEASSTSTGRQQQDRLQHRLQDQDGLSDDIALDASDVAYKLLLFVSYSLDGKVFPRGVPMQNPHLSLSWGLLQLLTSTSLQPTPPVFSLLSTSEQARASHALGSFPYLMKLSEVDLDAVLRIVVKGVHIVQQQLNILHHSPLVSGSPRAVVAQVNNISVADTYNAHDLSAIYDNLLGFCRRQDAELHGFDGKVRSAFFDLFLPLISTCKCSLSQDFLADMIAYAGARPAADRRNWELTMVIVAENQVRAAPNLARLAQLADDLSKYNFWLACAAAAGAAKLPIGDSYNSLLRTVQAEKALSFYISFSDEEAGKAESCLVFDYIEIMFRVIDRAPLQHDSNSTREKLSKEFTAALLKVVAQLTLVDLPSARKVARTHLLVCAAELVEHTLQQPKAQFQLLHAMLSDPQDDLQTRTKILAESFGEKVLLTYFGLLATYEPVKVLDFLRTYENQYPLDDCLLVCRQKGIPEAVSFLMERTGQVLDALVMLLKDFSVKLKQVRRDIDAQLRSEKTAQAAAAKANVRISGADSSDNYLVSQVLSKQGAARAEAATRLPCFRVLESIINCVADLCSRHCHACQQISSEHQAGGMWLTAFDHLLMERRKTRHNL